MNEHSGGAKSAARHDEQGQFGLTFLGTADLTWAVLVAFGGLYAVSRSFSRLAYPELQHLQSFASGLLAAAVGYLIATVAVHLSRGRELQDRGYLAPDGIRWQAIVHLLVALVCVWSWSLRGQGGMPARAMLIGFDTLTSALLTTSALSTILTMAHWIVLKRSTLRPTHAAGQNATEARSDRRWRIALAAFSALLIGAIVLLELQTPLPNIQS